MPQIIMSQQTSTYLGAEETKTVSQRDIRREKIQTERDLERERERDTEDEGLVRRCVNREDYLKRLANKEKEREIKVVIQTEASKGRIMELFR